MNSAKLKETIANIVKEESEYQIFFRKALEKAGKSITDMNDEEKKAFFNKIDATWDGKGEKNEGNTFGAERAKAIASDSDSFKVDGKSYKVTGVDAEDKKNAEEFANESVNEAKFKVLASFGGYDLIEAPTEKDMIISKNGKKVGKLTKISKYLKDDIKSFINMVKSGKLGESVNEGVSPADMDKIKGAVEAASSFMSVGSELKKLGMKYTFATEPLPIYIIQPTPNNKVAVVNKKYATKPDFVVGDIAVGIMEGKLNEEEIKWNAVQNAIINFLKVNTKILDKRVQAKDTDGVKGGLKSIISGLTNAQRSLKLESVNEAGYTVKAKNPYQFLNGVVAVLGAYLRDEELGPKGKRELQNILKSLEYMRMYFYANMSESVNEVASRTAMEIGGLTGLNKDAVQKFVDTHNMDIEKVYQYVKKSKLTDRLNFVTAVVGTPGNPVQKRMIKMFGESVNEGVKISLFDPNKNKILKTLSVDRNYREAEKEVETLNKRLSASEKNKGYYWKVTTIGESVNEGRAFINAARKAKQEGKTEFEFNGKKYPVTLKEGTLNEMNPQLNKGVKSLLDKELKDLRKGGSNHLFAVMNVLMGALTDANFHSESKKVPAIFGSKAKYEGDPMAQKDMESLYQSIGERIATMAKWDGEDIAKAVGFYVSMTIGRPLGQKIENLV